MQRAVIAAWMVIVVSTSAGAVAAEVAGRVTMPEVCAPEVSPAVVTLEPAAGSATISPISSTPGEVTLVNQRGLQFVPRVQAIELGRTIRFTNGDSETHNVHILSPGNTFNQSMTPGNTADFTPVKPGVVRLGCDIHSHMRGYVIVSATPWVGVCSRQGRFRLDGVPDGRYILNVWHEMGDPVRKEIEVAGSSVDVGTIALTAKAAPLGPMATAPVRAWADVVDRIGVVLATSLDAASRPGEGARARRLAEDAYWGEFEASDMETAVRGTLGFTAAGEIERQFYAIIRDVRAVADGKQDPAHAADLTRQLLLRLTKATDELNRKGVTDRAHLYTTSAAPSPVVDLSTAGRDGQRVRFLAFKRGLAGVRDKADDGNHAEAASAMTDLYFEEFEPIETFIAALKPQAKAKLELAFYTIRGEIGGGLKGDALADRLARFESEVEAELGVASAQPAGAFAPAFAASLVTIVREGIEVILILTMLITLVSKAGGGRALRAIWWGVGLAFAASAATAVGLNLMVASAHGRARETLEGLVMLAAAGVLFYVSYWLISQVESKRWLAFLKRQAQRGLELGGQGTLALTAFLAVYREGAETALMYQAMIGTQAGARAGLLGVAAGLGVGLIVLVGIALAVRATSVRLPIRAFFRLSGLLLFALAVVFAGNGVFELQQSGVLRETTLTGVAAWLGQGVPILGLYPNVQTLSVQGLLLAGAVLAMVVLLTGDRAEPALLASRGTSQESPAIPPAAGVGV